MDEVHNLARTQTQFLAQLSKLRDLLFSAQGMVLAGFTGTPILSEPCEGQQLLDVIKGRDAPPGNGGFISSFPMRPPPLFPTAFPVGIPDSILTPNLQRQLVKKVELTGDTLENYDKKRRRCLPEHRLRAYCSLSVHFGSFHDGKSGTRRRILADFPDCAPKLFAIAKDVAASSQKTLILINRSSGMNALLAHLQDISRTSQPRFGVATIDEIAAFNSSSNLRGERYRVLVADAQQCSEGVSFFTVRRVFLADVPSEPSALVQSVGRAIRMYGHRGLPVEEQTVTTTLYVSELPRWMRSPLGNWAYRSQHKHNNPLETRSKTRHLLRALKRGGITELEDLKGRLDAHMGVKPESAKQEE